MAETIIRPSAPASGRVTPSSFPFYTTGEDNLRVTSWNTAAGAVLKINGRTIDASGKATPDSWDHTPTANRVATVTDITLSGSTLLNVAVFGVGTAQQIGQTFVKMELIRGIGAGAIVLGTILQGYVTNTQALAWPGSAIQTTLDSGGYFRDIAGTTPPAGNAVVETVPTGARWELHGLAFTDVSGGGAVPVQVLFRSASGNTIGGMISPFNHPGAGASVDLIFTAGGPTPYSATSAGTTRMYGGLPYPMVLQAGGSFTVLNLGAQTYTNIFYSVREWLEP